MTTCLYMRMSTNMQEHSIESQRKVLTAYAKSHNMKIVAEYIDEGISGRKADKRPGFMQMVEDSGTGAFEAVLIYDSSRFARNLEESIVYKSMLKRNGVSLVSATEPNLDSESAIITDALLGAMNEMYSLRLSKNVRRGMMHNAQKGVYQCSPPYGYAIPVKKQPPVVILEEAALVRRIYDMYLAKPSAFAIARSLNAEGSRARADRLWESRHIERILTNPIYKGDIAWNKVTANSGRVNDKSEWVIAKGRHEAIISEAVFDEVQTVINFRKKTKNARPPGTYKHWLTGVMKCSDCGSSLTYSHSNVKRNVFTCNKYKKGTCRTSNQISQDRAEHLVYDMLEGLASGKPIEYTYVRRVSNTAGDVERVSIAIAKLEKKLIRIRAAYEDGIDTLAEYRSRKDEIIAEIDALNQTKPTPKSSVITLKDKKRVQCELMNLKTILQDELISIEEKNVMLRNSVDKVVYDRKANTFEAFIIF